MKNAIRLLVLVVLLVGMVAGLSFPTQTAAAVVNPDKTTWGSGPAPLPLCPPDQKTCDSMPK